jgi:hypothetical protein
VIVYSEVLKKCRELFPGRRGKPIKIGIFEVFNLGKSRALPGMKTDVDLHGVQGVASSNLVAPTNSYLSFATITPCFRRRPADDVL